VTRPGQGLDSHAPRLTRVVGWVIAINLAIYFVQLTVLDPADVQQLLGFQAPNLGHQWWTIATYMFVHAGVWHLVLSLYTLWLFGPRLEWRWGSGEFARYLFVCVLGGWFAHVAFVPGETPLIGASAAVLGAMLAYATFWPDEQLLLFGVLPMSVRWLVVILAGLNLVVGAAVSGAQDAPAYFAHAGGLVAGWLYLRATSTVNLGRFRQGVLPVPDEPEDVPPRAVPRGLPRSRGRERESIDDLVAKSNAMVAKRGISRTTLSEPRKQLTELDHVLDKISAHGIGSLSSEERKLLDDASRRLRDS
jgi:membrane associated rhomboid family serine protease